MCVGVCVCVCECLCWAVWRYLKRIWLLHFSWRIMNFSWRAQQRDLEMFRPLKTHFIGRRCMERKVEMTFMVYWPIRLVTSKRTFFTWQQKAGTSVHMFLTQTHSHTHTHINKHTHTQPETCHVFIQTFFISCFPETWVRTRSRRFHARLFAGSLLSKTCKYLNPPVIPLQSHSSFLLKPLN